LDEICQNARELSAAHQWDETDATARMLHVVSEVSEVADAVITWRTAKACDVSAAKTALGYEIFDAIWNLCALANTAGIDIDAAAEEKIAVNAGRNWPEG
jgi:NTP pyrophosphatase (non-canonical NTP hydrolase)